MNEYLVVAVFMSIFAVAVGGIFYATKTSRKINEELLNVVLRTSAGNERLSQSVIAFCASVELKNPAAGPAILGQTAKLESLASDKPPVDKGLPATLHGTKIKAGRGL